MIQIDITNGALTSEQIVELVSGHVVKKYKDNLRYFKGDNPTIVDRVLPVVNAPNYKLPVSYARKIIKTVVGYMYKPGLVTYNVEDGAYNDLLLDVFRENNEDTKTSAMGRQSSIQGVGYELHYTANGPTPFFTKVPAHELIPLYSWELEPELVAAIRHYRKNDDGQEVEVYYADRVDHFFLSDKGNHNQPDAQRLEMRGSEPHEYEDVPLVVYENNEEQMGDFEAVTSLIDAYDILLSDSMNEFDRFAWAYLVLKNLKATDQDANEVKYRRIIELIDDGEASFLQKDIPSDYIRFMSEWIRKEIHKQTHVPDFTDSTLGTEMTGAAIDRLFYDFEFIAADKEDRFRDALKRRIELVNTILRKSRLGASVVDAKDVDIVMSRNKPQMLKELAETGQFYMGRIADTTWLKEFAPFVQSAEEELETIAEERGPYRSTDANQGFEPEPEADTAED